MSEAVREFSTEKKAPPYVLIDGEKYNLKVEHSTIETLELRDMSEEYRDLLERRGADRTPDDVIRIMELRDILTESSIDAPKEVIDKLDDGQRAAIITLASKEMAKRQDPTIAVGDQSRDLPVSTAQPTG